MKLYEFMEQNDFDGELILNDTNFSMTCSFSFNQVSKVGALAFERYPEILNAEFIRMKDNRYAIFENKDLIDDDYTYSKGKEFLFAVSGYISVASYEACFPDVKHTK
ncbi:hypothetical protein [Enterococcus mundtii]|uniref:hypothetical protein n=1 Tax=Enterococcus mundtii TaxID=53346 RepID=UPI001A9674F7|nr:hypothetical protein [Enterococcus mundtii]MBO1087133.1 hypothetical protein [Enterococcus mundtii]